MWLGIYITCVAEPASALVMKVCFISHSSKKAGAERCLLETIDALKLYGVQSCVLLPRHGPLEAELSDRNIPLSVIPYTGWIGRKGASLWTRVAKPIINLCVLHLLAKKIKEWQCDLVYSNSIGVCVGAFAAALTRRPHVWHIHEFFDCGDDGLVFDFGRNLSLWLMDRLTVAFIANSKATAQRYGEYISPSKLKVAYQPVNIPKEYLSAEASLPAQSRTRLHCAVVGSLQKGKGQEDAIKAAYELVNKGIPMDLLIIGNGDVAEGKRLRRLVQEYELGESVHFTGEVEDPFPLMQRVDVVLVCSRCEAFGRVTIEAMKLGKPVVGARTGGTAELIRDGFNGLLYTPGDYKELAEKIRFLYEHADFAKEIGKNGLKWSRSQFTQEQYGKSIATALENVMRYKESSSSASRRQGKHD